MKKLILIFLCLFPVLLIAQTTSIYDIQYTNDAGTDGWSYPSTYDGQIVNTGGIVTATNYLTGQYFISSSKGGAWEGLFVYDNIYSPSIGDSILITGTVAEYQGYTELKSITSFEVKSTSNPLPETAKITTTQVGEEAYEGVLVELNNSNVSTVFDVLGNWKVDDVSGDCEISTGFFKLKEYGFPVIQNYPFSQIIGVIGINSWNQKLHPRSIDDIQSGDNALIISTDDKSVDNNASIELPVKLSILNQSEGISTYSLKVQYDPAVFEYTGFSKIGTISESGAITDVSTSGNIILNFSGSITCDDVDTLVILNFTPIAYGSANLQFTGTTVNGSAVPYSSPGDLEYASSECAIPIGDTLTIVQRPLLNIPSIVVPGEDLNIVCFAPETTTGWDAQLIFNDHTIDLGINQASYDSDLERWTLTTTIPNVDFYELFDLRVTADGGILDNVTNAVKVIDKYKDDYYFVHITDLHLLGHTFYGEPGYDTDHSEMDDFDEVIKDINLLNPEFVLLTGDLINEGELEDFECLRNFTLTVELLEKLEVPVYIVPGNHDIGGWDATPPPTGTARREWWRFFGWRQREIPPTKTEYFSHDYSFNYGNVHFTGLEAYETYGSYDDYMFDVYGNTSFTSSQISWLNDDLAAAGDKTKVLFYHYDFKHELDLSALGVDMALWGHTHADSEDATPPYDISTASVCDGKRTLRVIRVNNGNLQAESSVRTNSSGDMLTLTYNTLNNGSLDFVSATIQNKYNLSFNNGLIKFIMPTSDFGYSITNGRLKQVVDNGSSVTCYVEVSIPANGQITAMVEKRLSYDITSIYDIQYTTVAGDGTYPSTLNGQIVNTGGIVTATGYLSGRFFISSSQGGAWNGILVYDNNYSPAIGDSVIITGKVSEYNGYTELLNLTSLEIKSSGNTLPNAVSISTNEVKNEEFEGVLVEVNNCAVSTIFDQNGNFAVDDGTGSCEIRTGIYNLMHDDFILINDYDFESIKGVIAYNYGVTSIQPRSLSDIVATEDGFIVITEDKNLADNTLFEYPIKISIIKDTEEISAYSLKLQYNSEIFQYNGYDKTHTISETGLINDNTTDGNIELDYTGTAKIEKTDTLIKLKFTPKSSGSANIQFSGTNFNSHNLVYSIIGDLESSYNNTTQVNPLNDVSLFKYYPNPFSEKIFIEFNLQKNSKINISVYNISGQLIKILVDDTKIAGNYRISWDATNSDGSHVENGVYFYKCLLNGKQVDSGQILYLK